LLRGHSLPRTADSLFVRRPGNTGRLAHLLHELGESGRSWRLAVEKVRGEARLICSELFGFGRSP